MEEHVDNETFPSLSVFLLSRQYDIMYETWRKTQCYSFGDVETMYWLTSVYVDAVAQFDVHRFTSIPVQRQHQLAHKGMHQKHKRQGDLRLIHLRR